MVNVNFVVRKLQVCGEIELILKIKINGRE